MEILIDWSLPALSLNSPASISSPSANTTKTRDVLLQNSSEEDVPITCPFAAYSQMSPSACVTHTNEDPPKTFHLVGDPQDLTILLRLAREHLHH